MNRTIEDILALKPESRPHIYVYSIADNSHVGLLKVGQTTRDVKKRITEQLKTAAIKNYMIELDEPAERDDGTIFTDHDVRAALVKKGFVNTELEWMRCTVKDVKTVLTELRTGQRFSGTHHLTFKMRREQAEAVKKTHEYYHSIWEENKKAVPRFLWNAKMRFGKTFTTYQLARKLEAMRVLVVTFKPAVEDAWQTDLESHVDFDGWQYLSRNSDSNPTKVSAKTPLVYFGSFQDLLGRDAVGNIKPKNEWIHKVKWDLVVFDEYHFGAWRETAKELFEGEEDAVAKKETNLEYTSGLEDVNEDLKDLSAKEIEFLPITTKAYLYLSGTPFKALAMGEFIEEQIFNWTYTDEQRAKEEFVLKTPAKWNPYGALPQMRLLTYQMPDELVAIASAGDYWRNCRCCFRRYFEGDKMSNQASFALRGRNPDVLSCIANLSNDEVFTPPEFANQMLDALAEAWAANNDGANIWAEKTVKFLDPCTKSGVFLREITSRLTKGLADTIPNLQKRVDHILTKQVFGIGITHLTSLLARRSVYCSKFAIGKHSIAKSFENDLGNIWFKRMEHTWKDTKCEYCGAPKAILDREEERENYAYAFIHANDIKTRLSEIFGDTMQFDVIIGNPPYQMKGGAGGSSDSSIYHLFVEQAKKLEPKFLSMVVPSRWLAGGRGLDDFRKDMLSSNNLLRLVDFPVSKEVFPNVEVKGGICYFLWSEAHHGPCDVTVVRGDEETMSSRQLDEFDVFVRDPKAVEILRKVLKSGEKPITDILTADTPFGIATNFDGFHDKKQSGDVALYYVHGGKRDIGFVTRDSIAKNAPLIGKWKVLVPEAGSDGGQKIPDSVLGKPWLSPPPSASTQSFLAFWANSESEARSIESYYRTKFFRHLVSLRKLTQHALRSTYSWVPLQTWNQQWTDKALYKKYGLTTAEIDYIESVIRPMDLSVEEDDD